MPDSTPKKNKPRLSIQNELASHYTLSAILIISLLMFFVYWAITSSLRAKSIQYMKDEVFVIQELANAGAMESLKSKVRISREKEFAELYIRLLDGKGNMIIESNSMEDKLPVIIFGQPLPIESPLMHEYTRLKLGRRVFLIESLWMHMLGDPKIIQIGLDVTNIEAILPEYYFKLFLLLLIGIVLSSIAGRFIARKGMRPIFLIAEKGKQINACNLGERFLPQDWPVEMYDLTESLDGMLDRLQNSFESLKQYSANLAHELRTPVNNLICEAEGALTCEGDVEYYQNIIESNMEEYHRLSKIIDGMLFLAWSASSDVKLKMEMVNAYDEIHNLHDYYADYARGRAFMLMCDRKETIWADSTLLRRALSNLIKNAISYSPDGTLISIEVAKTGSHVELSVSDEGYGISPEHVSRIFERFYRVSSAPDIPRGNGLGLSIVKSIMELHGGLVSIESELGKGTRVVLKFPYKPLQ